MKRLTVQSRTGWVISLFSLFLLIANPIERFFNNEVVFQWQDSFFVVSIICFGWSIFQQRKIFKFVQVILFLVAGILTFLYGSPAIALIIFDLALFLAFTYSWFTEKPVLKLIGWGIFFFFLFGIMDKKTEASVIFASSFWFIFFCLQAFLFWGMFQDRLAQARKMDEQEKKQMEERMIASLEMEKQRADQAEEDALTMLHVVKRLEKK